MSADQAGQQAADRDGCTKDRLSLVAVFFGNTLVGIIDRTRYQYRIAEHLQDHAAVQHVCIRAQPDGNMLDAVGEGRKDQDLLDIHFLQNQREQEHRRQFCHCLNEEGSSLYAFHSTIHCRSIAADHLGNDFCRKCIDDHMTEIQQDHTDDRQDQIGILLEELYIRQGCFLFTGLLMLDTFLQCCIRLRHQPYKYEGNDGKYQNVNGKNAFAETSP